MNRRESLKALGLGTISVAAFLESCKPGNEKLAENSTGNTSSSDYDGTRLPKEIERDKKLNTEKFFDAHEMATITVLGDIIIPKDDHSGSASDAGVPAFIEFIVKDMPDHQTPMRGGLRWLDLQCLNRYGKAFVDASNTQQIEMVTDIAYPLKAKPGMEPGVSFFNLMRNLTASGFFSSKIGIQDIGYMGNTVNKWTGVPPDVLKQYGMENV
jgi:gluconate 2-dehydrogenase gamma chain